jgi:hypothetical protein
LTLKLQRGAQGEEEQDAWESYYKLEYARLRKKILSLLAIDIRAGQLAPPALVVRTPKWVEVVPPKKYGEGVDYPEERDE